MNNARNTKRTKLRDNKRFPYKKTRKAEIDDSERSNKLKDTKENTHGPTD